MLRTFQIYPNSKIYGSTQVKLRTSVGADGFLEEKKNVVYE